MRKTVVWALLLSFALTAVSPVRALAGNTVIDNRTKSSESASSSQSEGKTRTASNEQKDNRGSSSSASSVTGKERSASASKSEELTSSEEKEIAKEAEHKLPADFVVADPDTQIYDSKQVWPLTEQALKGAGVADYLTDDSVVGNYSYDDSNKDSIVTRFEVFFPTVSGKDVIVRLIHFRKENNSGNWSVTGVIDAATGNTVWTQSPGEDTVNVYDYATGKLVSEATKTPDQILEEYYAFTDSLGEHSEIEMSELTESYKSGKLEEYKKNKTELSNDIEAFDKDKATSDSISEERIWENIRKNCSYTVIDSLTFNDDLGTDAKGDYIALVNLTWNLKNSGKTSKKMLKMYSDDLAKYVYKNGKDVQELVIFWTVPYLNATAKCSYERKSSGMAEMDMVWDKAFE